MAKSSLQSGLQFRSVQRISSAIAESASMTTPQPPPTDAADEDDPEDVEEAAGEALDRLQPPPRPLLSPPLHDLAFLSRTCDFGKIPVSELHTFLPRYQSANELVLIMHNLKRFQTEF